MAETFTAEHDLSKFGQDERPPVLTADKLNANWDKIALELVSKLTYFPANFSVGKFLLRKDEGLYYENTGTFTVPVWTPRHPAFLKPDGTVVLTGDLDFGTKKGLNVGAPTPGSSQIARISDVEAAALAAVNTLGIKKGVRVSRTASQVNGASPTVVSWAQADFLFGAMWTVGDPTKVYVRQDGLYDIQGHFIINDGGFGGQVVVRVNGADRYVAQMTKGASAFGDSYPYCPVAVTLNLVNGDYIQVFTYGINGAGAHSVVYLAGASPFLSVCLSASNASGGGDFLADGSIPMTGNLNLNGFKAIAAADATTATGLTTKQQVEAADAVLQAQIDAITAGQLDTPEREMTAGDQAFSGGSWTDITGSAIVLNLTGTKKVAIDAEATALPDFQKRANSQLGIKVQKTGDPAAIYPGTFIYTGPYGYNVYGPVTAKKKRSLGAGEWTITMVARQVWSPGASTAIAKNAEQPARIGVTYIP